MSEFHESTEHLGDLPGPGVSLWEAELMAWQLIGPNYLHKEAELMETAWWDYRPLHPTHRTLHFAACFDQVQRECYAADMDFERGPHVKGWRSVTIESVSASGRVVKEKIDSPLARHMNAIGFWRARQAADAIGARYSVFIRAAFKRLRDAGWGKFGNIEPEACQIELQEAGKPAETWTGLPRPAQLYSEAGLEAAVAAWEAEKGAYFQLPSSDNPYLRAGSDFWAKPAFDAYLEAKIAASPLTGESDLRPRLVEAGFLASRA